MSVKTNKVNAKYFPRTVHYENDGTGRDSYIRFSNGGFLRDSIKITASYQRGIMEYKKQTHSPVKPIEAKFLHYTNDGTGRDTYCGQKNSGQAISDLKFNYLKSLRTYESPDRDQSYERLRILKSKYQKSPKNNNKIDLNSSLRQGIASLPKMSIQVESSSPKRYIYKPKTKQIS